MELSSILLFLPACFALNLAPGPNNLLSIHNATNHGFKSSCIGGLGRLAAFSCMLFLASIGLAVVLHTSEIIFYIIKAVGVLYLIYLAIQLWRAPVTVDSISSAKVAAKNYYQLAKQEFLVAIGNPKAILIFTAFLPQFVNPSKPTGLQFTTLGILFLCLEFIAIMVYAYIGLHMQKLLTKPKAKKIFNRICASLLSFASLALLFTQRSKIS